MWEAGILHGQHDVPRPHPNPGPFSTTASWRANNFIRTRPAQTSSSVACDTATVPQLLPWRRAQHSSCSPLEHSPRCAPLAPGLRLPWSQRSEGLATCLDMAPGAQPISRGRLNSESPPAHQVVPGCLCNTQSKHRLTVGGLFRPTHWSRHLAFVYEGPGVTW